MKTDDRDIARTLAFTRIGIGAAMVLLPGFVGRRWVGPGAGRASTKTVIRSCGIRDLVIGVALVDAIDDGRSVRRVMQLAAACDAVDAGAIAIAGGDVPASKRIATFVMAAGAAVAGVVLADRLP